MEKDLANLKLETKNKVKRKDQKIRNQELKWERNQEIEEAKNTSEIIIDSHNNILPELKKIGEAEDSLLIDQEEVEYLVINNKRLKQVTMRLN